MGKVNELNCSKNKGRMQKGPTTGNRGSKLKLYSGKQEDIRLVGSNQKIYGDWTCLIKE